ncbi:hypothetical protein N7509_000925 [Penicillium cosmopolitanum]|uniref:Rhodopsin domain-containing protein n=1 Tax=Penicillium cosmopolitanum TaxID=1131564 RepID=A0A9W9WBQ1_9EURO|nr:uncharacterized protein N7509_000925 [Penicillium cosmopolitanum]KAJ5414298.1 hypothetical protein N7509_000925 [Penicillium cosmopolitanum]
MVVTAENEHESKGPTILAVLWTLTSLTFLIVSARVFIRLKMLKMFGADDYLIVIAMALGLAYCGATTASVVAGFGQHQVIVLQDPSLDLSMAMLLNNISFLLGILSFTIPKIAVTAMITRIFNPGLVQKIILWTLVSVAAAVSCICIIILFTMCNPPRALWTPELVQTGQATCKSVWMLIDYAIFTGAVSATVDLYLALYPMLVLMNLQMSLRKRIALSAALGLGAIAAAMAIVKCTQLHGLADKSDYTYGKRTWSPSLRASRRYNHYSKSSSENGPSAPIATVTVEVIKAAIHNGTPLTSEAKDPSLRKDDLAITNVESQESILRADNDKDTPAPESSNDFPMSAIRRTDNFTVEYNSKSHTRGDTTGSW